MSETTSSAAAGTKTAPKIKVMRSQLGRVRGLGAAGGGAAKHWRAERLTAIALIPLTLFFIHAALHLAGHPRIDVAHWMGRPWNAAFMLALIAITFHHMQMGLQVVIEDYIHMEWQKMALLLVNKAVCGLFALVCAFAILKLAATA